MTTQVKYRWRQLRSALAIGLCVYLCVGAYFELGYRRAAGSLMASARHDSTGHFDCADANRWLHVHGFGVRDAGGGFVGSRGEGSSQLNVVVGFKKTRLLNWWLGVRWIEMEFQFSRDCKLIRIVQDRWYEPPPSFLRRMPETRSRSSRAVIRPGMSKRSGVRYGGIWRFLCETPKLSLSGARG